MARLPAFCSYCGIIVKQPKGIKLSGTCKNVTVIDCTTLCPHCNQEAQFIQGTFNVEDGVIHIVDGPDLTYAVLEQAQKEILVAQEEGLSSEVMMNRIDSLSPKLASWLGKFSDITPDTAANLLNTFLQLLSP